VKRDVHTSQAPPSRSCRPPAHHTHAPCALCDRDGGPCCRSIFEFCSVHVTRCRQGWLWLLWADACWAWLPARPARHHQDGRLSGTPPTALVGPWVHLVRSWSTSREFALRGKPHPPLHRLHVPPFPLRAHLPLHPSSRSSLTIIERLVFRLS
jgi:hypothetical protein